MKRTLFGVIGVAAGIAGFSVLLGAQTPTIKADYDRAFGLRDRVQDKIYNVVEPPTAANWITTTSKFWYRKSVKGGNAFVLVDPAGPSKAAAFDHDKLAAALSTAASGKYTGLTLPFSRFTYCGSNTAGQGLMLSRSGRICSSSVGSSTPAVFAAS